MGVPPNHHPFVHRVFPNKNHPASLGTPMTSWKPPFFGGMFTIPMAGNVRSSCCESSPAALLKDCMIKITNNFWMGPPRYG